MITYLQPKESDLPKIKTFCDTQKIDAPQMGLCFIAKDDVGDVVGIINLQTTMFIEPLASSNPLVAHTLYNMLLGAMTTMGVKEVQARVKSDKTDFIATLEKLNFVIEDKDMTILRKELN